MKRSARLRITGVCLSVACLSASGMGVVQSSPETESRSDPFKVREIDAGLDGAWFLLEIERDPRAAIVTIDAAVAASRHPVPRIQRRRAAALRLSARALLGVAEEGEFEAIRNLDGLSVELERMITEAHRRATAK